MAEQDAVEAWDTGTSPGQAGECSSPDSDFPRSDADSSRLSDDRETSLDEEDLDGLIANGPDQLSLSRVVSMRVLRKCRRIIRCMGLDNPGGRFRCPCPWGSCQPREALSRGDVPDPRSHSEVGHFFDLCHARSVGFQLMA